MASVDSVKKLVFEAARAAYEKGLISAFSGNVSARIPGMDLMVITPSGVHRRAMKLSDLVVVDFDGRVVEGYRKPSSEWRMHRSIYRAREDVGGVVHAHVPFALALSLAGFDINSSQLVEVKYVLRKVERVPPLPPGSEELALRVAQSIIGGVKVVLLECHGAVAVGRDPLEAEGYLEALEEAAKTELLRLMALKGQR